MPRIFQTAPNTPSAAACRTFQIPNSLEWLGIFNALYPLMINPYNWEQVNESDLTVDESVTIVKQIWATYWATTSLCDGGCTLPDIFTPPFRLGVNGRFEQLLPDGTWGEPAGEYAIPPTPARDESTSTERKCNAAANAAHVMELLYEAITDEIALGGDALQVAAAMVAALVTAVGGWIAAPVYAIIQLSIALFVGMIELLQALGSDVWTTEFNERLKCALYDCATDTDDVVTFDLDCIREKLYEPPDLLSPTWFYELQLFAQVLYLMETITMDGLNAAGATTYIEDDECSCITHCMRLDFTLTDGASLGYVNSGGNYVSGQGYEGVYGGSVSQSDVYGYWDFGVDVDATEIRMLYLKDGGTGANDVNRLTALYPAATSYNADAYTFNNDNLKDIIPIAKFLPVNHMLRGIGIDINTGTSASTARLIAFEVYYKGDIPEGWEDNCPE